MKLQTGKCVICGGRELAMTLSYKPSGVCQRCYAGNYPPEYMLEEQEDRYWRLLIRKRGKDNL